MTLNEFIREHKQEIDDHISHILGIDTTPTTREREIWVMKEEGLYNWARDKGVDI